MIATLQSAGAVDKPVQPVKTQKSDTAVPLPNRVDMSIKPGNVRNISEVNVFSPLNQSKNQVDFISFMGKGDTKSSNEFNLGYGRRTLVNDNHIIGYYGYWDVRRTGYDNVFNQITVGAEYLSDSLDVRLNGYIPINKYRTTATPAIVRTTGAGVTISHANREYAMGGWDLELGTQYKFTPDNSLHVYAGRFDFRSGRTTAVRGNRYRTEMRFDNLGKHFPPNSRFTLGWETQRDKVRGRARYSLFRLSIPLYTPQNQPAQLSGLRRRLIDPVIRDVDIVAGLNTKTENAHYADKNGKASGRASGIKTVATGADLYRATTTGKDGELIVVTQDITTSLEMTLQKNQRLTTAGKPVKLVTPSGISVDYVPVLGTAKTLKNTVPGSAPVSLKQGASVDGLKVVQTVYNNPDDDSEPDYMDGTTEQPVSLFLPTGGAVALTPNAPNSYYQAKAISPTGGAVNYQLKCMGAGGSMVTCTGLSVDSQGKIRITSNSFTHASTYLIATDESGISSKTPMTVFSHAGLATLKTRADGVLQHDEQFGDTGIRLYYGNDFTCAGDADKHGRTCTTTGTTKVDEVKRILNAYLDPNNPHTDKIIAQLRKSKPTMTMLDVANQKSQFGEYLNYIGNTQDLQADETFANGKANGGGNTAGDARSAAVEELIHMVQNYGITRALPEWQERLDKATADALSAGKLKGWEKPDLPRRDLDDEYFADGVEAYFNMRAGGGVTGRDTLCGTIATIPSADGKDCSTVGKTSRQMLQENHRPLYDLIQEIFGDRTTLY